MLRLLACLACAGILVPMGGSVRKPPSGELAALRADARFILGTHCGKCHDSRLPTAKLKALAIFDLGHDDWANGLTDERLDHMLGRLESFGVPEPSRVKLRAFVDAEKRSRL